MKTSHILFHEESRPPRFLTWPLVFLGTVVVASKTIEGRPEIQRSVLTILAVCVALSVICFLEFLAVVVEVDENEVRFSVSPLYRRKVLTADIQHHVIRTYNIPADPASFGRSWRPPKRFVELTLKDGSLFAVMLMHPEQFSKAIIEARPLLAHDVARHAKGHNHHQPV